MPVGAQDEDCFQWNNAPNILCYQCNSCKAGVMEQVRQDWHKISVLNVIVLVFLICICACGCCAFRNARRSVSEYPYGVNRMSKINPRWDYYWYFQPKIKKCDILLFSLLPFFHWHLFYSSQTSPLEMNCHNLTTKVHWIILFRKSAYFNRKMGDYLSQLHGIVMLRSSCSNIAIN
jgi:hypothetical protein